MRPLDYFNVALGVIHNSRRIRFVLLSYLKFAATVITTMWQERCHASAFGERHTASVASFIHDSPPAIMATVNPMRPFDDSHQFAHSATVGRQFKIVDLLIRQRLALWWGGVEFIAITQFFMFN